MVPCKLCNRETKYNCVICGQVICNVCSVSVPEETLGYNYAKYTVGKCPYEKCDINVVDEHLVIDEVDDVSIIAEEPPVKKMKLQKDLTSFFVPSGKKSNEPELKPTSKHKSSLKQLDENKNKEAKEIKKRTISVDTINSSWISVLLKLYHPQLWFTHENDGQHLISMKCSMCTKYEKSIDHIQGFNSEWIVGSTNFRSSNAERHATSKAHGKAMEIFMKERNEIIKPTDAYQTTLESGFVAANKKLQEQTKKKFEVSYFVAKHELSFTKYEKILDLEEMHGVDIGPSYRNDMACAEFIDFLGDDLDNNLVKDLARANFYSVLSDGSTDSSVREQECTFVLYFDPKPMEEEAKDKVKIRMGFLGLKNLTAGKGGGTAVGVFGAIKDSFTSLGVTEFKSKLVGFGADGASVNRGNKEGVIAMLREEMLWIIFNWCLSHRLELAVKEALAGTMFDVIDEMLLRIYYLYEKSPKKLSELFSLKEELKHTFEFEEGRTKPVRSCGTRWIAHKLNAMRLIVDKFGLYMEHLERMTRDRSYKKQMQSKKGYLKVWKNTPILVHFCFYIELLTPISHLSLALQKEEINPVKAIDALDVIQLKLKRLRKKPVHAYKTIIELQKKCDNDDTGEKIYQGFHLKRLPDEIKNVEAKKEREFNLIANVIEIRLKDHDSYHLNLIAQVLNCKAWDRTKSKRNEDGSDKEEEDSDDECEEDLEFADEAILVLLRWFKSPLEHAGVFISESEMLEEWRDLVTYTKKYLTPKSKPILKTWREIFDAEGNFNNILKLVELCFVIPISNAVVERFFSRMKRVKSNKRGSFTNERLEKVLRIGETGPPLDKNTVLSAMNLWNLDRQRRPNQGIRKKYKPKQKKSLHASDESSSSFNSDNDVDTSLNM